MGVEFNENKPFAYNYEPKKKGGMGEMIIKMGLAKDDAGAQKVLLIVAVICFILSIYFFLKI